MNKIELYDYLQENDADFNEVYEVDDMFAITIEWGDWKHSHLRADYLMKQIGYILFDEELTESDGSDCYSSIHIYKAQNNV